MKSVYSAVRTGSLNKAVCASSLIMLFLSLGFLYEEHNFLYRDPRASFRMCRLQGMYTIGRPGAYEVHFNIITRANEIRSLVTWYVTGTWNENRKVGSAPITKHLSHFTGNY